MNPKERTMYVLIKVDPPTKPGGEYRGGIESIFSPVSREHEKTVTEAVNSMLRLKTVRRGWLMSGGGGQSTDQKVVWRAIINTLQQYFKTEEKTPEPPSGNWAEVIAMPKGPVN